MQVPIPDKAFLFEKMRYQKIHSQIWHDEKFIKLKQKEKFLFLYLLTCPHSNAIGCYYLPLGYITEDLKISQKDIQNSIKLLKQSKFIQYDENTNVLLITNFIKHNPIDNVNLAKCAMKIIYQLPKSYIIQTLKTITEASLKGLISNYISPFEAPTIAPSNSETEAETETETETEAETEAVSVKAKKELSPLAKLWNDTCFNLPRVKEISEKRSKLEKLRLKERSFESWKEVFIKIGASGFCCGNNNNSWKASYDWIISNADNAIKTLEGKYDNRLKDIPKYSEKNRALGALLDAQDNIEEVKQWTEKI